MGSCLYPLFGHGDLKIDWLEGKDEENIQFIQAKMDAGVTFHIIDPDSKAKNPAVLEIENTNQITGREVYVRDQDIGKLIEGGAAAIARFSGIPELKVKGRAKTAEEAVKQDTVAIAPKRGG